MRTVIFLDLDDSIFQTRPKCPPDEPVRPAAFARDGSALSFMTDRQRALLEMMGRAATVVPTTARNLDAFRRVDLAFDHAAILDYGAVVLAPGGELDAVWDAEIRPRLHAFADELTAAHRDAARFVVRSSVGVNVRLVSDFDMTLYLVAKHAGGDGSQLRPLRDALLPLAGSGRFFLHYNDNNLALVPNCLGKEKAVRHVLAHYFTAEPVLTLGVGDSLTDAPFLAECDFAILPRASQLTRLRLQPDAAP